MMQSTTTRMTCIARRAAAAAAAMAAVLAAGCSSGSNTGTHSGHDQGAQSPTTTTDADWKPVADTLGRTGKLGDGNSVYRVALPRTDLHVTTDNVAIKPGLSLGGYAAFARYSSTTLLMGDLVVIEAELPKVTDALQAHGIAQTALHKHLLEQSPPVWWTHIHAMGDATELTQGLKAVLDATSIAPTGPPPVQQPPVDLDAAGVQQVIAALRAGNIALVELHNHSFTEQPRLFYAHFWAVDDAVSLAKALRTALDATNVQPA
jgi:hypothetical protein